jgi:predicted nucleotide-binding protein (sugar kinase/HSP70/actin superfamily)
VIGLVGEIYLRFNNYSNLDIVRRIEAAGGEVMQASLIEFLYHLNWGFKNYTRLMGRYFDYIVTFLTDKYQQYVEYRLVKPVAHLLDHPYETPVPKLMDNIRPYYDPTLGTEAVLSMGKAIELAHHGVCGLVNVMPFSCMPGILTTGMAPRLRRDLDNIPWLDITYDAQGGTNINTRLEAFMYQAIQFQRRQARPQP